MSKYCSNCGKEVSEGVTYCSNCGNVITETQNQSQVAYQTQKPAKQKKKISGIVCLSIGAVIGIVCLSIGAVVGIIGIIIWFVIWYNNPGGAAINYMNQFGDYTWNYLMIVKTYIGQPLIFIGGILCIVGIILLILNKKDKN